MGEASPYAKARGLAGLIAGQICLHGSMAGMRLAAPLLALKLGYGAFAVGVLLALFSLTQVVIAIPAGAYADRHGVKRCMGLGIVVAVAGACLAAVWPSFEVLCISALMMGGATGAAAIALQRHVGRSATDATELKRLFSWVAIGPAVSNFLGPVLAGLMIDFGSMMWHGSAGDVASFQLAFIVLAMLPMTAWVWVRGITVELEVRSVEVAARTQVWALLQRPDLRRLLLVNWLLSSCWDVHTFVVPVLGHQYALSASVIGAILGSFAIAATAVRVVIPLLAEHLHEWVVLTGAMLITATVFFIYPMMKSPWSMGACSVLLGFALGAVQPMIMSTLHQMTPHHLQGQAVALRWMSLNLSSVLMPMVFGSLGMAVGVSVVFWTAGVLVASGSRLAWKLRPQSL
jgi:MFS family permease